ncbi:APC family permease [Thermogemmatispora sp.]|uniref:APC family permease n=1 Tax=Thermogemmatispora sp. TaxID=1968838 RepID=UPI001D44F7B0|nr:APC family permease [Thermogemmatispora sp.]MBX5450549.1 APC family permease [Thermogemmatispora sp.]
MRPSTVTPESAGEAEQELPSESYVPKAMPATLGTFDLTAVCVLGMLYLTNAITAVSGGAATLLLWLLGGVLYFLPSVIVSAQLGVLFPRDGSLYSWTHHALGRYWSFLIGFCWWLPGPLLIVTSAATMISYFQGLNRSWLIEPWQQGLAIIGLIILSGILASRRLRIAQNLVNVGFCASLLSIVLISGAGAFWLLQGHQPATSFRTPTDWIPTLQHLSLFGLICGAYSGVAIPLNMGGEVYTQEAIPGYLRWSTLVIPFSYLATTLSLLLVQGPATTANPFALVTVVDSVLGKLAGNITVVALLFSYLMAATAYNYSFARILFVGSIDQRLPGRFGYLNRERVPGSAIALQTTIAVLLALLIFIAIPYILFFADARNLSVIFYNVSVAAVGTVWQTIMIFIYIDLAVLLQKQRDEVSSRLIIPRWLLWLAIGIGPLTSLVSVIASLLVSWIPQQLDNAHWQYSVIGLMSIVLIVALIGSLYASSEASWQRMRMS